MTTDELKAKFETLRERYFYAVCGGSQKQINSLAKQIKAIEKALKDGTDD